MSTATRDRILDEAMRLFGEHGYRGTTIASIEAASGLTPGAGGIYHHFPSKEAMLEAGIERQLARLDGLRAIRGALGSLGDLRAELTLTARYVLRTLDDESEFIRLLAFDARHGPARLTETVERLLTTSYGGFATWLAERSPAPLEPERAAALAATGLGSLLASRLLRHVLGVAPTVDDEALVAAWVDTMALALGA